MAVWWNYSPPTNLNYKVMEAKEAPEKLYLLSNGLISYCRNTDEDVEYTRTDAFIEKACKYISYHQCEYIDFDDLKKYMKGDCEIWQSTE